MYVDSAFKKHVKILYYAKMLYVAHALFQRGSKDSSIASSLLVPVANVKEWRKLYEKGELLKVRPYDVNLQNNYSQHDLKRLAREFFEMGLRCRPVSLYLNLPLSTIYSWHAGGGCDEFRLESQEINDLKPYEFAGHKFTTTNNRRRYSYEARQVAKECFLKGMSLNEIALYMDVERTTVDKWKRAFEQGHFYVNEQEQLLYAHSSQNPTFDPFLIEKKACKELSAFGFTDKQIASAIHVPIESIQAWKADQDENLKTTDGLVSQIANDESLVTAPKTEKGRYTNDVRQAAKECFEKGYGYKFTAKRLGISQAITRDWCRLYKEGRFKAVK